MIPAPDDLLEYRSIRLEQQPAAPQVGREWFFLFFLNGLFSSVLTLSYLVGSPGGLYGLALWSLPAAAVSQAFFLNLMPALVSGLAWLVIRKRFPSVMISAAVYAALQIALMTDVVTYRMFRRHFDGVIWGTLTAPGIGDSIHIGLDSEIIISAFIIVLIAISCGFAFWLVPKMTRLSVGNALIFVGFCVLWERSVYAAYDFKDSTTIYWVKEYLPLYQPLTFKKLSRRLGIKMSERDTISRPRDSGKLWLPKKPIGFSAKLRRPNIMFLFVDSARADALQPRIMPELWKWHSEALWLTNHCSSGNATGEGVFGVFYGLPAMYYPRAVAEMHGSAFLDALADSHYDFEILSCVNLHYLHFDNFFFRYPASVVVDQWDCPRYLRDETMTDSLLHFLAQKGANAHTNQTPFFAFALYDAAHQPYYCPLQFQLNHVDEAEPEINYPRYAAVPAASKEVRPCYDNGLHYADHEIGRIIESLKTNGLYDNTILIVLGDHGEEFGECGRFGHVSQFDPYQIRPLCLARFPGGPIGTESSLTSHVDFVPSILDWMGATNEISDYSTGRVLGQANDRTYVLCCGTDRYALIKNDSITVFDRYKSQYFDAHYRPLPPGDRRRPSASEVWGGIQEMDAFIK